MDGFFDALANAELSLFGILPEPADYSASRKDNAAEPDDEPPFVFDDAHYRQAAG